MSNKQAIGWTVEEWHRKESEGYDVVLCSEDFTHDAALRLSGDFESDEQRMEYAQDLCDKLNAHDDLLTEVIHIIEAYQVPVGNSAAGEMAAEWTMAALREIRDEIVRMRKEKDHE